MTSYLFSIIGKTPQPFLRCEAKKLHKEGESSRLTVCGYIDFWCVRITNGIHICGLISVRKILCVERLGYPIHGSCDFISGECTNAPNFAESSASAVCYSMRPRLFWTEEILFPRKSLLTDVSLSPLDESSARVRGRSKLALVTGSDDVIISEQAHGNCSNQCREPTSDAVCSRHTLSLRASDAQSVGLNIKEAVPVNVSTSAWEAGQARPGARANRNVILQPAL